MPVVIKRDETGKDPKARKAAPASSSASKASTKAASAGAKTKSKGAKKESNELPKVIGAIAVIVLAVGFFVWYMFLSGGSSTGTEVANKNVDRTPAATTGGTATANKGGGGISTDESAPTARKGGLGRRTEGGGDSGGEGID